MKNLNQALVAMLMLGALLLGGCTTRSVVRFEDHPQQDKTYVETLRHDNYYVTSSTTHEFWLCDDQQSELVCRQTCDGKTDLACPSEETSINITGSNVR